MFISRLKERNMAEKSETVRLSIEELDHMLNKIFTRRHSDSLQPGQCPSVESLAALIDGQLNKSEKQNLLVHLSSCQNCYETVSETILIERELKAETAGNTAQKPAIFSLRWRIIRTAIALGTAAVLVFVFYNIITSIPPKSDVVLEQKKDRQPSSTKVLEPESAINSDHHAYIREARKYKVPVSSEVVSFRTYAFSENPSNSNAAFRSGVLLIQLEAALANNQKEVAQKTADLLARTLTNAGAKAEVTDLYVKICRNISNESFQQYLEQHSTAEEFLQSKGQFTMMKFGEWLECALLAESSKDTQFLQSEDLHVFKAQLSFHSLPRGVRFNLDEIDNIMLNKDPRRSRIIRLLQDTIEILWESA
jgi:hypothetical protein